MNNGVDFRVGQRVRIRRIVNSDFAGFTGIVVYVGDKVCDVKISYKLQGADTTAIHMDTFSKSDLEIFKYALSYLDRNEFWQYDSTVLNDRSNDYGRFGGMTIARQLSPFGSIWKHCVYRLVLSPSSNS